MNRCGNVAAILELDENLDKKFTVFEAAPQVSVMCFVWFVSSSKALVLAVRYIHFLLCHNQDCL